MPPSTDPTEAPFAGPSASEGGDPRGDSVRERFAAAYLATSAPLTESLGAKLVQQNKLYVRDRIALLFDDGSFVEDGRYANALAGDLPADGVVTGRGRVDGRPAIVIANDPTVKAGCVGCLLYTSRCV